MLYPWATITALVIGIILGIVLHRNPFPNPDIGIKPHEKQILGMSVNNAKESKQKLAEIKQMAGPDGEVLLNSLKSTTQITLSQGRSVYFNSYFLFLGGAFTKRAQLLQWSLLFSAVFII